MFWQYRHIVYKLISNIPTHDCLCVIANQHSRFLFDLFKNIMTVSAALHLRSWSRSKWQKQHFLRSCSRKHIASIILPQHLNRFSFFFSTTTSPLHRTLWEIHNPHLTGRPWARDCSKSAEVVKSQPLVRKQALWERNLFWSPNALKKWHLWSEQSMSLAA